MRPGKPHYEAYHPVGGLAGLYVLTWVCRVVP